MPWLKTKHYGTNRDYLNFIIKKIGEKVQLYI
jgi:hypothetical protein